MKKRRFSLFLAGLLTLFSSAAQAGLCPMCRLTLQVNGNQNLIRGFLFSVLVIGGVPLVVAFLIFFNFYRHRRSS